MAPGPGLRQSPLHDRHQALGAKLVAFGGWEMPLSYPQGTVAEHLSCRRRAAAFDVSHLGTVRLEGPGAFEALQSALTNDLARIGPGRAQYTHLLDEDGSVLDDLIVWWVKPQRFDVMPNASNPSRVRAALGGRDVTDERAVIAVQGPEARRLLAQVCPEAAAPGRFAVSRFSYRGAEAVAAGTGYTGEPGVECALAPEAAGDLWDRLVDTGVAPAGLGARDSLRLEAGLPLHGHELGPGITPLQAGLGWVVAWHKPDFPGKAALERERRYGPVRRLRGLLAAGRRPPRRHQAVLAGGRRVGEVTSGGFSPVLGRGIALALLEASVGEGEEVEVDAPREAIACQVVPTPFVAPGVRRG